MNDNAFRRFADFLLDAFVACETGSALKLDDKGVKRAVPMMRRAEILQPRVWLAFDPLQ
jgi:hypothetical protein